MILIKENENIIGLFHNSMSDSFLKNTIDLLGLIENNVTAYDFTSGANKIKRYERDEDKFYEVDGSNIRLKTIQTSEKYEPRLVEVDDLNALEYYSQEFIDNYNANEIALSSYDETSGIEFVYPYSDATPDKKVVGQVLVTPATIIEDEIINGSLINISDKIATEQGA
jgi:hypothetical protein